jgi:hypothetical protein
VARGRIISRTLGTSRRFADLSKHAGKLTEFAQALYPMVVVHSDDHGRQHGDAFTVKHAIWPTTPRTESEFDKALRAMEAVGLIARYAIAGVMYLQVLNFDEHQQGLHKRRASKFPEFPGTSRNAPENPGRTDTDTDTEHEPEPAPERRDVMVGFDAFWSAYPKKTAKADAQKAWRQVAPSEVEQPLILAAIARQRVTPQWQKDDGQYIPNPSTYLRQRRWEDMIGLQVVAPTTCRRRHSPPCPNDAACTKRYMDEQQGIPAAVAS